MGKTGTGPNKNRVLVGDLHKSLDHVESTFGVGLEDPPERVDGRLPNHTDLGRSGIRHGDVDGSDVLAHVAEGFVNGVGLGDVGHESVYTTLAGLLDLALGRVETMLRPSRDDNVCGVSLSKGFGDGQTDAATSARHYYDLALGRQLWSSWVDGRVWVMMIGFGEGPWDASHLGQLETAMISTRQGELRVYGSLKTEIKKKYIQLSILIETPPFARRRCGFRMLRFAERGKGGKVGQAGPTASPCQTIRYGSGAQW